MKSSENLDQLRTDYLAVLSDLSCQAVERACHLPSEIGMSAMRTQQDAEESRKAIDRTTKQIAEVCNRARAIEQRARGGIGIPAVFGSDVPNTIRVAIAVLAGNSLTGAWSHECRVLGTLVQTAGGADPQELLTIREAFRKGGLLRKHCHCDPGRTMGEIGNVTLTESVFRKLLALEPDDECDELLRARALLGVTGKR
jgi:hypothetical protein